MVRGHYHTRAHEVICEHTEYVDLAVAFLHNLGSETKATSISHRRCSMAKYIQLALAWAVALSVSLPAVAQAQQPPPLPPECQTGQLSTGDPQYPVQLILICLPPVGDWNGQVVAYAHGYAAPQAPLSLPLGELTLPDANGQLVFGAAALLRRGFAFVTTSYRKNGSVIEHGGKDLQALVEHFNTQVAPHPAHKVFVAGGSEGGLI